MQAGSYGTAWIDKKLYVSLFQAVIFGGMMRFDLGQQNPVHHARPETDLERCLDVSPELEAIQTVVDLVRSDDMNVADIVDRIDVHLVHGHIELNSFCLALI